MDIDSNQTVYRLQQALHASTMRHGVSEKDIFYLDPETPGLVWAVRKIGNGVWRHLIVAQDDIRIAQKHISESGSALKAEELRCNKTFSDRAGFFAGEVHMHTDRTKGSWEHLEDIVDQWADPNGIPAKLSLSFPNITSFLPMSK